MKPLANIRRKVRHIQYYIKNIYAKTNKQSTYWHSSCKTTLSQFYNSVLQKALVYGYYLHVVFYVPDRHRREWRRRRSLSTTTTDCPSPSPRQSRWTFPLSPGQTHGSLSTVPTSRSTGSRVVSRPTAADTWPRRCDRCRDPPPGQRWPECRWAGFRRRARNSHVTGKQVRGRWGRRRAPTA